MEKKVVIEKAGDFAKRSLIGKIENINREDYYMFLVSRFLLLKEMIIKKDSENNVLYFNYDKNKKYLPAIKYIVDYIKRNGMIKCNSTTVVIEPSKYNTSDLQFYIWTFNKIRDSFAHGMYDFDLSKNQLVINNDHSNSNNSYALKCSLPIEMLEFFTYAVERPKNKYSEEEIEEFKEQSKKMRNNFGYNNYDVSDKIIKNYNDYFINSKNIEKNIYKTNNINNDIYNNKNINNDIYNNKNINNDVYNINNINYEKIDNYNLYNNVKEQEEILELLLLIIKSSNKLTEEQRRFLYDYLRRLGFIDSDYKVNKYYVLKNEKTDKKYIEKLATVISEISTILGIKSTANNILKTAALYNYMQLTFSLNEFDFQSKEEKESLGYLKISKLNPKYLKYNNSKLEENDDSQYAIKIRAIQKFTENFVIRINQRIEQYKQNPSSSFRQSINDLFKKYYEDIIDAFADKNSFILTSIRNSIEHANIHDVNGQIMLNDQGNQNNNHSINFCCYGTADDFLEITNALESGVSEDEFTFDDFLNELKSVIDVSSFSDILLVIDELKSINIEALVNVLKQSSSK